MRDITVLGMRDSAARRETRSRSRERGVVQSQGCGFFLFSSCSVLLSAAKSDDPRETGGRDAEADGRGQRQAE